MMKAKQKYFEHSILILAITGIILISGCINNSPDNTLNKEVNMTRADKDNDAKTVENKEEVAKIDGKITIDGKISDWTNIPVFLQDKKGDIDEYTNVTDGSLDENGKFIITGRSYNYDVTLIKITSDDNNLFVLIEFADDLEKYFNKNREYEEMGGTIGKFYVDIDNKKESGEEELFTQLKGFEKKVLICVSTNQGYEYSISYWLDVLPFDFNERYEKSADKDTNFVAVSNNFIEMTIPLDKLEISKGQTIRVIFSEKGNKGTFADAFSEEIIKQI